MNSIAHKPPESPRSRRPEIPVEIESAVMAALEKDRDSRTQSAEDFRRDLESAVSPVGAGLTGAVPMSAWQAFRRPAVAAPVVGVVLAFGAWAAIAASRGADERWAREEAMPEVLALIDRDEYGAALALAEEIEAVIPNDPLLAEVLPAAAVTSDLITDPPGADVYVQPYDAPDGEWRHLGQSPIEALRLPRAEAVKLRIEMEGYEPRLLASAVPGYYIGRPEVIHLREAGVDPEGMVLIPGGSYRMHVTGFGGGPLTFGPFLIDRYEVTNAEYKEFVDAGGYENPEYWEGLDYVRDGQELTWDQAMASLVDETGRPGPATWAVGDFPEGQGDYPVTGVSWYEAVAYNAFRGKSLPTIYHWGRAAIASHNNANQLGRSMLPRANFEGDGPRPVGSGDAMGTHGVFDMAGNVKEWNWNASGEHHWLLGGAWDDDPRMASVRFTSPPFDRSSRHGFRGVRYLDGDPAPELTAPVDLLSRDYRNEVPVSDEVYEVYRRQLAYIPGALNARVESVDDSSEDWTREHVTLDAGYADERFSMLLFLPTSVDPPFTPLVFFYGLGPFASQPAQPAVEAIRLGGSVADMLRAGRAVAIPVWNGSFERWDDFLAQSGEQYMRSFSARMGEWAEDLGRTLDYLETREDIDDANIGYWGISFGSSTPLALLALEERLKAALLFLPGYTYRDVPPEIDAVNFVPRITLPVLMVGGRYDYVFPVETAQEPLYDHLGTPEADKQHLIYPMGHGPYPRQMWRDVLPWLDEYLGPVE